MNSANRVVANRWVAAFNPHDLDKLPVLYHDDAVHYNPQLKIRLRDLRVGEVLEIVDGKIIASRVYHG